MTCSLIDIHGRSHAPRQSRKMIIGNIRVSGSHPSSIRTIHTAFHSRSGLLGPSGDVAIMLASPDCRHRSFIVVWVVLCGVGSEEVVVLGTVVGVWGRDGGGDCAPVLYTPF